MTVYLVRHADALSRRGWSRPDHLRPLAEAGFVQAAGLVDLHGEQPITRFITSPAVRCRQTLEPLAGHFSITIEEDDALMEGAPLKPARKLLDSVAGTDSVLCSHGDLIPDLVNRLIAEGMDAHGRDCKKGSTWVLDHDGKRFVKGRYLPAP